MPSEYRLIFFDPGEIAKGAVEWKRAQGARVPDRKVVRMSIDRSNLGVTFHFAGGGDKAQPLVLKAEDVTAALLVYCRRTRIPLPMRAAKKLVQFDDQLAFMFSMPSESDPPSLGVEYLGNAMR